MAENKMEQVVKVNCFDNLFGKNGKLVEERKKQVLAGALEIVQRYCEETPNKMKVVAKLFNKKLGERFSVKIDNQRYSCSFEEYGFNSYGAYENPYLSFDAFILQELLTGTAVIDDD